MKGYAHHVYSIRDSNSFVNNPSLIVVSHDPEILKKIKQAFSRSQNELIGYYLGYPQCCINFICRRFKVGDWDPTFAIAVNTEGLSYHKNEVSTLGFPYLNIILRYFGVRIIPWLPCSFSCKEAYKKAKIWYKTMVKNDDATANVILRLLSQPVTWTIKEKTIFVNHPNFIGVLQAASYSPRPQKITWQPLH